MNELTMVLDELAAEAPLDQANWADVVARTRKRPRRARRRLVLVPAVLVLLALSGTAVGVGISLLSQQEHFHAAMPDDPERIGPLVEITGGPDWALIGWRSEDGICLDFAIPGNSPFGCGFPVRGAKPATDSSGSGLPTHAVAGFFSGSNLVGGDGKATIFGVAAHEVAAVKVELGDGRVVDAPLYDAPAALGTDVRFFIVRLSLGPLERRSGSPIRAYSAYDRDGRLIERAED
ncbi:MAG TPA: hypothetical protein VF891_02465 [Gaiellaceae bacterium]